MSAEGQLIAGRYRLQERIGSGAMGVVWRAVDERLHRTVAVKQLLLQPGTTPEETEEARQRTMREGRIAARLQHQNAIVVFDEAHNIEEVATSYFSSETSVLAIRRHLNRLVSMRENRGALTRLIRAVFENDNRNVFWPVPST